ncbi:Rieske 2Fe-2S domain-containing protein [Pseudomaricurvus alkylphenolicus]|uniref:Rieske (2Fe-2S) protein n=1 Tax=Pseudomaricurvus alkylphenolicus TaxID=1306991 RepID=UPI0014242DCF|nr:Rieske 2Fe-2S domain-containing protein [Pseudomaricurvus alkylphenolicus]NIB38711.1 Rieske 2Fe-2S domain-containing protein [Pseudomaricurvus alkylphenolicus]
MGGSVSHCVGVSSDLQEKGPGILFRVIKEGTIYHALMIRINQQAKAYLNVCAHAALRLNGDRNTFFSRDGNYLYCHAHGATYEPETGLCIRGPCEGLSLIPLTSSERDGRLYLEDETYQYYE